MSARSDCTGSTLGAKQLQTCKHHSPARSYLPSFAGKGRSWGFQCPSNSVAKPLNRVFLSGFPFKQYSVPAPLRRPRGLKACSLSSCLCWCNKSASDRGLGDRAGDRALLTCAQTLKLRFSGSHERSHAQGTLGLVLPVSLIDRLQGSGTLALTASLTEIFAYADSSLINVLNCAGFKAPDILCCVLTSSYVLQ